MNDDQSRRRVLEPARQFVRRVHSGWMTGTYLLMSCSTEDRPPYREGLSHLRGSHGHGDPRGLRRPGWRHVGPGVAGGDPADPPPRGVDLAKDGVIAVYFRHPDMPDRGVLQVDGECRNLTDHQLDSAGFVDVTADLTGR